MTKNGKRRRWRRRIAIGVTALFAIAILVAIVVARTKFHGKALASYVQNRLNDKIRGKVSIGSIEWPTSDITKVVTGGWVHLTFHDVKVLDDQDDLVIRIKRATAELDVHEGMFDRNLIFRNVIIKQNDDAPDDERNYAFIKLVSEPYPVHEYDTTTISLISAFYPEQPPSFRAGLSARPSRVFDLESYTLEGADIRFSIGDVQGTAKNVTLTEQNAGYLRFDGRDPLARKLYYSLTPQADSMTISSGPIEVALENIVVGRLAQTPDRWPDEVIPRDVVIELSAITTEGAIVTLEGRMKEFWTDFFGGDYDLTSKITNAGSLAASLSGGIASGKDLTVKIHLGGPIIAPRVTVNLSGVDVNVAAGPAVAEGQQAAPPLALHLARATAGFDLATESGYLEDTVATGAGGEIQLASTFNLNPTSFDLHLDITKPIDVGPYLPAKAKQILGNELSGSLHAVGNRDIQRLSELDLTLGRAHVQGEVYRTKEGVIHADGVKIAVGGTTLRNVKGTIDIGNETLDLDFGVVSNDIARWLRYFRAPAIATTVSGTAHVGGHFDNINANANLVATGVPIVNRVNADLDYADGVITVKEAESSAFDGWLRGSGKVVLTGRVPRFEDVEAQGVNLRLDKIPVFGRFLTGEVDLEARAVGPVSAPDATVTAKLEKWSLAGEAYRDVTVTAKSETDGSRNIEFHLDRLLGGKLDVNGGVDGNGDLIGIFSLRKLPLESLAPMFGIDNSIAGGTVNAELQLSGTPEAPTVDGTFSVVRGWFRQAFLGSASVQLERVGDGLIRIRASLFQGAVRVDGTLGTTWPFKSDFELRLRRVELDRFVPALAATIGARGWVSGVVRWRGDLMSGLGKSDSLTADFTEAVVLLDNEDADGRPAPIRLQNRTPVRLAFDGTNIKLLEKVVVKGPAGDFTLSGSGTVKALDFRVVGVVSVKMLEPYLRRFVETAEGRLDVQANITGPIADPSFSGIVLISNVQLKPLGQDTHVTIPSGKIEFTDTMLSITGLTLAVTDEYSDESAELTIGGGVALRNFKPTTWALTVDGQLAGKMLLVVAPQVFSEASGTADLSVMLGGIGVTPDIDGTIEFSPETPLTLTPRGIRREIALTGGLVKFTDQLVELENITGWVDDEGQLTDITGEVSLEEWVPIDIDITVAARDLPFRIPQELELSLNVDGLRVVGGFDDGIEVEGRAEVVDGRYIRKFNPLLDALRPTRSTETSAPFYEGVPLLAEAKLNLTLVSRAFFVKNNVADIELNGRVNITGTPAKPNFDGVIRVEHGTFKFQGIRAKFERTQGTVTFSRLKKFPEDTPVLDLRSESDYRDISGQDHLVNLRLTGPISNLNWNLSTGAGLNKAQTLTLIFAGRTTEEARASLGDEPIGRRAGELSGTQSTAGSEGGLVIADQLIKDLAGDFFSLLIEDPIRNVTKLDVARLELGTASIGFHGEKKITKSLRSIGEFERTLRGWTWDVRGEYRLTDRFSIDGEVRQRNFDDDAQEDDKQWRLKASYRWVLIP